MLRSIIFVMKLLSMQQGMIESMFNLLILNKHKNELLPVLQKKNTMTEKERKVVAVHESGHAVISWFLKGCDPLVKLTIIPRSKGSLGFA